jgi:hypothetical protein
MENLKIVAIDAYRAARIAGNDRVTSGMLAWSAVRQSPGGRRFRAPDAYEKLTRNTGCRRAYGSPLHEILTGERQYVGTHSGKWRRTDKSRAEVAQLQRETLIMLDLSICVASGAVE